MAEYDYIEGKKRIDEILDNKLEVIEKDELPNDSDFTFKNSYFSWVTSIFVDIRDSSILFSDQDKPKVSKIIRSFSSEVIEILRKNDSLREIGIRGDCIYGIYTTELKSKIYDIFEMSMYINTFMKMLNKLLTKKSLPTIKVGIGLSTSKELVVKAGRKDTGINSKVWIGEAVTKASNLSSLGNKTGYKPIVLSNNTYINIIDQFIEKCGDNSKSWFDQSTHNEYGIIYDANLILTEFNDWIEKNI
ncbi:adenylate cyclase [Leptospira noumeaensis]|uniref:Adenylate cyclase n=1 Tax=Leptospira noumeaensis TaxID=2484964 RepID=A0A4V3JKV0_9LEPT|nr:adenylate/guanylate cyclase domain-containing protein [Leptospira noumeaensis]TGK87931.1 adenylate cyclase [Leptospira noumeaensis]